MEQENFISLRKGDTLVKYTIKRDPQHGIDLTFTIHQALQDWMKMVAVTCVDEGTANNGDVAMSLFDMDRGAQDISILDDHGSNCWQFNRSEHHNADSQPSLRFESGSYWYKNLAFLRLCTTSLERRIGIRTGEGGTDLWRKQFCSTAQVDRHLIAIYLDRAISKLILSRVVVDTVEVTTAHILT